MKKLLIFILIVAVLLTTAVPVLAAESGWGPTGPQGNYAGDGQPGWAGKKP